MVDIAADLIDREDLRTPLQLANEMDRVLHFMKKGTNAVNELRKAFLAAKNRYLGAFLLFRREVTGAQAEKDNEAQLANWDFYVAMTEAESEVAYAKDKLADLERELSKLQTESRLVIKEMEMSR